VRCDGCHASYEVKVLKEGNSVGDLGSLHCLFCASDVSLYGGGENHVERTNKAKAFKDSKAL
jgi:hypothetical protein